MKNYLKFARKHLFFLSVFLIYIIFSLVILFSASKVNCFIWLNSIHNKWLDDFFIPITFIGNGMVSIALSLLIIIVWKQYRLGIGILVSFLLSGIAVQILKNIFSKPRPKEIIASTHYHFFMNGITHGGWSSFPSGHTASAFALITMLIFYFNNRVASFSLLILAIIVGYSRIYLGQHFLGDVIGGSILGVTSSILVYNFTHEKQRIFSHLRFKKNGNGKPNQPYQFP